MGVKLQTTDAPAEVDDQDGIETQGQDVNDGQAAEGSDEGSSSSDVKDADLLSVARDVLANDGGKEDPESSTGKAVEGSEAADGQQAPGAPADPDDFEANPPPFAKHPRWKQMMGRLQHYRQGHQQFEHIRTFLDSNSLSNEEAADLLIIGGLMKTNPVAAWERVKPHMEKLALAAGEILAPELREQVEKGQMTRETALQISRSNAKAASATQHAQHAQQVSQRRADAQLQGSVRDTIANWEAGKRSTDPDYGRKEALIRNHIIAHMATNGRPATAAAALQIAEDAYKAVSTVAVASRPRPQPKRMVGGGRPSGTPASQPKTHLDYVKRALGKG